MKNPKGNLRFWLAMISAFALGSLVFTTGLARHPHRVFAATYMTMNNPFYQVINTELRKAVTEHGDRLVVRDPLMNANKQIEQVEQFIEDNVDGIFVNPVDSVTLGPVLRRAQKAGIPVIAVDSTLKDDSMLLTTVISDNYDAGRQCGQDLLDKTDSARIWLLRHSSAVSASERIQGFLSVVEPVPGYTVIGEAECEGQLEQAMPAMEELIRLHPDGSVVMALNDPSALGAIAALEEAGLNSVMVYGIDGTPDMKSRIAAYPGQYATVAQSPISIGSIAAHTMYEHLSGKHVPHYIPVEVSLIDGKTIGGYSLTEWQ
ncbi:sugar ABC transporter substrate-binding protein [Faecalibaculum rodentium]|uniref:sugar ABC transporter substrate-binding protein n=1 Tax=Faecalibaculum rodentium TaxID=1702221 RepID=UPI0025A4D2BE|nr:sugar ABC transporter substrate-binding protein [Faecalibaculum rodentium]